MKLLIWQLHYDLLAQQFAPFGVHIQLHNVERVMFVLVKKNVILFWFGLFIFAQFKMHKGFWNFHFCSVLLPASLSTKNRLSFLN